MPRAFIAIGSNIEPEQNVRQALRLLSKQVHLLDVSTIYLTEPEGRSGQPPFYNGVVEIDTRLSPVELKKSVLQPIEEALGRVRSQDRFAPRTIDLDLILYDRMVSADEVVLPDPLICERAFLAVPLYELAPRMTLPDTETPLSDVAAGFADHRMHPLREYTRLLKEEFVHGL